VRIYIFTVACQSLRIIYCKKKEEGIAKEVGKEERRKGGKEERRKGGKQERRK
jgi:hypothetical protein